MAFVKLIQPGMIKRPIDTDIKIHMAPPLGLLTIAGILKNDNKVVLENENITRINYDDNPDIVGISVTVDTYPRAVAIAEQFRKKGIIVVAGGIHISTAFDYIDENAFDVLCIGAAEGTWPDIIKDYKNNSLKRIYRCEKILSGEDIVGPAYDIVNSEEYLYCNVIHTGRGCPFKCDFCYNSGNAQPYVNRNIDDVIREIKALNRKHIMIIDDNFAGNVPRTKELLIRMKDLHIKWNAAVSINIAYDEELLDLMKESGCQGLFIGFESINKSSVEDVHKVQNMVADYDKAIKAIHDRGIMINASLVFGLDSDTVDTFKETLDWIVRNKIETVTSHILTPYPGTKLYERMKAENRIITEDLSLYNTSNVVFKPKNMTPEELKAGYLWIYKNVYSFKNIRKRRPEKTDQRAAYYMFNYFYRKFGKFTDFLCKIVSYERIGRWGEKLSKYI